MTRNVFLLWLCALSLPATAQTIYSCTNEAGGKVYTTSRDYANCKPVPKGPESTLPALPKGAASAAAANPTPAGFPKVAEDKQKARDNDRRHILEQELAAEQRNLDTARRDLAELEAQRGVSPDRLAPYRERVGQHERNIQAIQKEMGNMR